MITTLYVFIYLILITSFSIFIAKENKIFYFSSLPINKPKEKGFTDHVSGKEPSCQWGDIRNVGLIPGSRRSPEKEMATYSSIRAWEVPWIEEHGSLQSMVSQRVRYYRSGLTCMQT